MKVFTQFAGFDKIPQTIMALGSFDGIHIGHQTIMSHISQLAQTSGGTSVVFTFSNHPLSLVNPGHCPSQISTAEDKIQLIQNLGVDVLFNIPFSKQLLNLAPEDFVLTLVTHFDLRCIVVGANYTYGYRGAGTSETLQMAGRHYGFDVRIVDTVRQDSLTVSSTVIRKAISTGNIELASTLLGRTLSIKGQIIRARKRGGSLGCSVVNIAIEHGNLIPDDGVYAVEFLVGDARYNGIVNLGESLTVIGQQRRMKVFIVGGGDTLYGQRVEIKFIDRIRSSISIAVF